MKKKLLNIFLLSGIMALLMSCSADMDLDNTSESTKHRAAGDYPSLTDVKVEMNNSGVNMTSGVIDLGDYTLKSLGCGFLVSSEFEVPPFQFGDGVTRYICNSVSENNEFEKLATNIQKDVKYYVRAYAIIRDASNVADTIFSNVSSFIYSKIDPVLETMPVVNRARRGACVFARFKDGGNEKLSKWGVCLSRNPLPTPKNCEDVQYAVDTCKLEGYMGEFGAFFETLEPRTMYHVRAFVITAARDTIFGEDRVFRTTEGGNYDWRWASNESGARTAGAYDRITEAMDSASYYYNNYSNLYLRARVEYNTGVQTADCSYGGWIRFGPNSRYQWVGTAQHETAHGLGVGTAGNWRTLIDYNGERKWTKPVATRTLRAVMNDQTLRISADGAHFWPGGINQREEVTNGTANSYGVYVKNERMLRCNAMILNGMQIDGLSCP